MRGRVLKQAVAAAAMIVAIGCPRADAQVRGEIVGPGATRMPIAVPELRWEGGTQQPAAAHEFVRVLRMDLEKSGIFRVVDPATYIVDPQQMGLTRDTVNFDNWMAIGALGLITGAYSGTPTGMTVEVRFFDVADRSSSGGRRLSGTIDGIARLAHRMADVVMEFVTGVPGPFDSRIAFVSNRDKYFREVYAYSFDGSTKELTHHGSITMAPAWHPSNRSLLFTSFRGGRPILYSMDLQAGTDSRLASKMGVNVGGVWSPDGTRVLLARENEGNTDIFELDPARGQIRQLTTHWGIDVDPAWSPDGRRIAFCSSRSGGPQVYTMTSDGNDVRRVTFDGDYNCSPVWSPDGKYIAYAGRRDGRFQIFVIDATGGQGRQLTFSGSNEDPTWSPDSRYVAYAGKRGRNTKIYMMDIFGRWETQLTDGPGDDSSPNWSSRLE